jgi:hypothetical protein
MSSKNNLRSKVAPMGRLERYSLGFSNGLSALVQISGGHSTLEFPGIGRTAAQAFHGDWNKLGTDMRRASDKVIVLGKR